MYMDSTQYTSTSKKPSLPRRKEPNRLRQEETAVLETRLTVALTLETRRQTRRLVWLWRLGAGGPCGGRCAMSGADVVLHTVQGRATRYAHLV